MGISLPKTALVSAAEDSSLNKTDAFDLSHLNKSAQNNSFHIHALNLNAIKKRGTICYEYFLPENVCYSQINFNPNTWNIETYYTIGSDNLPRSKNIRYKIICDFDLKAKNSTIKKIRSFQFHQKMQLREKSQRKGLHFQFRQKLSMGQCLSA